MFCLGSHRLINEGKSELLWTVISQTCWREQLKHLLHRFYDKSKQQLLQAKANLEPAKQGLAASDSEINIQLQSLS